MVYQFFPRSQGLDDKMKKVLECFQSVNDQISSLSNELKSNDVLRLLREPLENLDYVVEKGRKKGNIKVPVLFGMNNKVDRVFLQMQLVATEALLLKLKQAEQLRIMLF